MNITYYTVASTRCMGIWRDEIVAVPSGPCEPPKETFNGFETREAAENFILHYPEILRREYPVTVRNVKIEKEENDEFRLTYESLCGWGENRRWKQTCWCLGINQYTFNLIPNTKDILELRLK